ncbi:MAG TPA: DUF1361 domain-containing protein [Trichocoleus sp.]|jgi:uncharacterized membrane protein
MSDKFFELLSAFSNIYSGWILWNLFLAFIPLGLSFVLFRRKTAVRPIWWWVLLVVFIAFLPNAPYMLTDVIHLIRGIRAGYSGWVIALIFIPLHVTAILAGFEAYVISLINQGSYLKRHGAEKWVLKAELLVHALCAVGIYIGRFRRFNSWDLVSSPTDVVLTTMDDLTSKRPIAVIVLTFIVLTVTYWILKQITLGIYLRIRYAKQGKDVME